MVNSKYYYMHNDTSNAPIMAILGIYLIILSVMLIFYIVGYIFKGIGMYQIAKRQGMDCPWLAFVPFARVYLQGELAGEVQIKTKSIRNPGIPLLAIPFIGGAINFIFYILFWIVGFAGIMRGSMHSSSFSIGTGLIMGMLIVGVIWFVAMVIYAAVYKGFGIVVNHQIYAQFTTKNMSILHAVFGKFVPMYEDFCFFAMRNKDFNPGMEPQVRPEPVPQVIMPPVPEEEAPEVIILPAPEEEAPEVIIPPAPEEEVPENQEHKE